MSNPPSQDAGMPRSGKKPKPAPLSKSARKLADKAAARARAAAPKLSLDDLWAYYVAPSVTLSDIDGEVEFDLVRYCQRGGEAARLASDVLVRAHTRTIKHWMFRCIYQVKHHDLDKADLFNEARIGFLKAVRRYDFRPDVRLTSYAQHWIRHQVTRACVNDGFHIRVPVWLADQVNDDRVRRVRGVRSLNRLVRPNEDTTYLDLLPAPDPTPEEQAMANILQADRKDAVAKALQRLSPKERHVIRRRVMDKREPTLEEVGVEIGVTRERVRQIEQVAKYKLRRALEGQRHRLDVTAPATAAARCPNRYVAKGVVRPYLSAAATPPQAR